FSHPTGSIIPRGLEFAFPFEPAPYDPARARRLLSEARYPSGFGAGDFYPHPPYISMGDGVSASLQAGGIRARLRPMRRAAFLTAFRERKLHGVVVAISGTAGNAATRLQPYVTRGGIYAYEVIPEVDDLFQRQARELDRTKREALLHQI